MQRWSTSRKGGLTLHGPVWRRTRDAREFFGQFGRIVAAALITWIWVPVGNSGRANMSALASAPIPADLAQLGFVDLSRTCQARLPRVPVNNRASR